MRPLPVSCSRQLRGAPDSPCRTKLVATSAPVPAASLGAGFEFPGRCLGPGEERSGRSELGEGSSEVLLVVGWLRAAWAPESSCPGGERVQLTACATGGKPQHRAGAADILGRQQGWLPFGLPGGNHLRRAPKTLSGPARWNETLQKYVWVKRFSWSFCSSSSHCGGWLLSAFTSPTCPAERPTVTLPHADGTDWELGLLSVPRGLGWRMAPCRMDASASWWWDSVPVVLVCSWSAHPLVAVLTANGSCWSWPLLERFAQE